MKRRKWLCGILTVCVLVLAGVLVSQFRYPCVRRGVSLSYARSVVDSESGWFIVTQQNVNTGAQFEIAYGENLGVDVELIGDSPNSSLSKVFLLSRQNYFLVHGTEMNSENIGKEFSSALPKIYTIDVDSWEIITPVRRDYQYSDEYRWFYPLWCIDGFDQKNGDYTENSNT